MIRKINYSFTGPVNITGVSSYRVYAKLNDYADTTVPDDDYLIAYLPSTSTSGSFQPTGDGNWYLRVYSANEATGLVSSTYASGSGIVTAAQEDVKDVTISSLRLANDFDSYNLAGNRITGYYSELNPVFAWQVGALTTDAIQTDYSYRVTIRSPSSGNRPSDTVYYEITGYKPTSSEELEWTFPFNDNVVFASGGPYRSYDVVVEAMVTSGLTSAGSIVSPRTETEWGTYNQGYDILYAHFPRQEQVTLTSGGIHSGNFKTKQWIDTNGDVHIDIISGELDSTVRGGYLLHSSGYFTGIGTGLFPLTSYDKFYHDGRQHPNHIVIPSNLTHRTGVYASLALYDAFDEATLDKGTPILESLPYGRPVPLRSSGQAQDISITDKLNFYNVQDANDFTKIQIINNTGAGEGPIGLSIMKAINTGANEEIYFGSWMP